MSLLKKNDLYKGFRVIESKKMDEYDSDALWFLHEKTSMQVFHLHNDDRENFFSFTFKTPPEDSCGTPHIIEHSVLSGSKNYPVKDPFVYLLKSSLNTFLNAMTYPDKTVYPASSTVKKDLFNLMSVYGDAVFNPLLRKEIFHQEGRRFQFNKKDELEVVGIVYNEMKGSYSSHESILNEWSFRSLFSAGPYTHDSGGEPFEIMQLDYDKFLEFHKKYYQFSNCLVFLYGDIPTEEYLDFLDEKIITDKKAEDFNHEIVFQDRNIKLNDLELTSPTETEENINKASVSINWLGPGVADSFKLMSLELLSDLLLGNDGAPLYKGIVESGLGEDLSPVSGLETDINELIFSVGIRGIDPDKKEEFKKLVLKLLSEIAENGFEKEAVTGVIRKKEFRSREIKGGIPNGLRLMDRSLRSWLHGSDPFSSMEITPLINRIKEEYSRDNSFFEKLLKKELLENNYRSLVTVRPDINHAKKENEKFKDFLQSKTKNLSKDDIKEIKKDMSDFSRFQKEKDIPEDIAKLPSLELKDLPEKVQIINTIDDQISNVPVLFHDYHTNGIIYLDIAVDISDLSIEEKKALPLFSKAFKAMGLVDLSYDKLARTLDLHTGGFYIFLESGKVFGFDDNVRDYIFFRIKALSGYTGEALALISDIFKKADFTNRKRLMDIILELKNDTKSSIIPSASSYAALRASGKFAKAVNTEELWKGLEQFDYLNGLSEENIEDLISLFERLRNIILDKSRISLSIAARENDYNNAKKYINDFLGIFNNDNPLKSQYFEYLPKVEGNENFIIPSDICFNALAMKGSFLGTELHAHRAVLSNLLKGDFLWEKVRMKGGAYGVSASEDGTEGIYIFSSYRDPEISKTFSAFKESIDAAAKGKFSDASIKNSIIGTVGKDLKPLSPSAKNIISLRRRLYNISDDLRQNKRSTIIGTQRKNIINAAELLKESFNNAVAVVLAGEQALKKYSGSHIKAERLEI